MVSIIVPVYNVRPYIYPCIMSILSQSYTDIELILVNDGSTDGSGEICRQIKEKYPVILIEQSNQGLSAARNAGLSAATGDYIMFVDADDYISSDMVSSLVNTIGCHDIAMCQFYIDDHAEEYGTSAEFKDNVWTVRQFWHAYYNGYHRECVVAWNKLYRCNLFETYRFPVGKKNEDEYMISHLMQGDRTIALCKEYLYYYVQRPESIMTQRPSMDFPEALLERIFLFQKQKKRLFARRTVLYALYVLENGDYDISRKRELQQKILKVGNSMIKTPIFAAKLLVHERRLKFGTYAEKH